MAFAFMLMTAIQAVFSLIMDRMEWINALKAVTVAPVVGVAFGLVIAAIARSEQRLYAKKLHIDVYGLAGGLLGFFLGGILGLVDPDNEFRWLGIENNAMVVGCITGLIAGATLMAVVGEVVSPSGTSEQPTPPASSSNESL